MKFWVTLYILSLQTPGTLTTAHGAPIGDKTNSLTAGPRGPLLLQDHVYIEEIAHFDRERIPERVVHAKGAGAFGYFEVTHDISKYCKVLQLHISIRILTYDTLDTCNVPISIFLLILYCIVGRCIFPSR